MKFAAYFSFLAGLAALSVGVLAFSENPWPGVVVLLILCPVAGFCFMVAREGWPRPTLEVEHHHHSPTLPQKGTYALKPGDTVEIGNHPGFPGREPPVVRLVYSGGVARLHTFSETWRSKWIEEFCQDAALERFHRSLGKLPPTTSDADPDAEAPVAPRGKDTIGA